MHSVLYVRRCTQASNKLTVNPLYGRHVATNSVEAILKREEEAMSKNKAVGISRSNLIVWYTVCEDWHATSIDWCLK